MPVEGARGGHGILQRVKQIRCGFGVDITECGELLEVVANRRHPGVQVAEDLVAVDDRLPELVAQSGQRLRRGAQREVHLHRIDVVGKLDQRLEHRVELRRDRRRIDDG